MNVMIDHEDNAYVIDWGASMIADSRIDLAWSLLLYSTFGGVHYRDSILETYSEQVGRLDDLVYFEVLAAARRISDLVSVASSSASHGLKPGALDAMRESRGHFVSVHDLLEERVGLG